MEFTSELKTQLVRLAKDQERIRLAFEVIESIESMLFYRGRDEDNPRIQILRKLKGMDARVRQELLGGLDDH